MRARVFVLAWAAYLMLPMPWVIAATASAASAIAPLAEPNSWQYIVDWVLENAVKPLLSAGILALVGMVMAALAQWLKKHGIEIDQARQQQLNDAAVKSLEWALTQALDKIAQRGPGGWQAKDIQREVINNAKDYAVEKFPDSVKWVIGSTEVQNVEKNLTPVMERLLPKVITEVAASPATPPAPPPTAVPVVEVNKS